jgi:hypothetical protein
LENPWPPLDRHDTMSLVASFFKRDASSFSAHSAFSSGSFLIKPMTFFAKALLCFIFLSTFFF